VKRVRGRSVGGHLSSYNIIFNLTVSIEKLIKKLKYEYLIIIIIIIKRIFSLNTDYV
jgi:hypothetical protein